MADIINSGAGRNVGQQFAIKGPPTREEVDQKLDKIRKWVKKTRDSLLEDVKYNYNNGKIDYATSQKLNSQILQFSIESETFLGLIEGFKFTTRLQYSSIIKNVESSISKLREDLARRLNLIMVDGAKFSEEDVLGIKE